MNIVALYLIVDLLTKRQLMVSPSISQPAKPKTVPPPRGLGLFELGKIEEIKQPLIIDSTKIDYGQLDWKPDYLKGKF
jgi:hypothetical protein